MTKQQYIDSIHEQLGPALRDEIEKQLVEVVLNDAYNQIVYDLIRSGIYDFDICRKRFPTVAVTHDDTSDVYYSTWPAAIVPYINGEMIVNTVQGSGIRLAPMDEQDVLLTEDLPVNGVDTTVYTIIKRERLEYYNMESLSQDEIDAGSTPTPLYANVRMDLAIQFKEFDSTDQVYMPMGRDYEVKQLALDMLRKEQIIELRNN